MKNKQYLKIALVVAVCLAMILPFLPFKTEAVVDNFAAASAGFKGKTLSILGDSISTFGGISNSTSYNTTIGSNAVYYPEETDSLSSAKETWWMQAIDTLGMSLCVNNSWSGSCVSDVGSGNSVAYKYGKRCVQLHNDNTAVNPDIIAIYLGTNDIKHLTSDAQLKNSSGASYPMGATMNADGTASVTFNYSTVTGKVNTSSYVPESILEAYALTVYRTLNKYSSAEVYCFTLLPNESQNQYNRDMYALYNAGIRAIVKHFNDSGKKIYLVDLYENSGIDQELVLFDLYLANTLHPNPKGMDVITNCFLSSLVSNSQYRTVTQHPVTYDLNDAYVTEGQVTSATAGEKFSVSLLPTHSQYALDVTVTMDGEDVTGSCYSAGTVLINNVTGPVSIKAEAAYETRNYRWELQDGELKPCVPDGTDYHVLGDIDTKELVHRKGTYTNGAFEDTQYHLPEPVVLRNEEPWVLEWKGTGAWGSTMLFTTKHSDAERNNSYLFFSGTTLLGFGFYKGYSNGPTGEKDADNNKIYEYQNKYTNFAVSTSSLTLNSTTSHTYRMVNKITDGSNMVYLYVDGVELGTMDNYYWTTVNKNRTDDWVSGRDFVFHYMGADARTLRQCSIDYIQVWEGGSFDTSRLTQLQQEFQSLQTSVSGYTGYNAYQQAVNNSYCFIGSQEQCDAHVDAIISARNQMTQSCDAYTSSGEIISVELVTGDYARVGKQTGMRITTAPDVTDIGISTQKFGTHEIYSMSTMLQTVKLNVEGTYQDVRVKVWLVTFDSCITSENVDEIVVDDSEGTTETTAKVQALEYIVKTYLDENAEEKATFVKNVVFL